MKERVECSVCGLKQVISCTSDEWIRQNALYPKYAPDIEILRKQLTGIMTCRKCGYTAMHIGDSIGVKKEYVGRREYKSPFAGVDKVDELQVKCYRIAMQYRDHGCKRIAKQWFVYVGLLTEDKAVRKRCLLQALVIFEWEIATLRFRTKAEIILAYLNIMRLLGMYECVLEIGQEIQQHYMGLEKILIGKILALAEKRSCEYFTYYEILEESSMLSE